MEKIKTTTILIIYLIILIFGCHAEATRVTKGTVKSIEGNKISFIDETGHEFSCYGDGVLKGEEYYIKFDTKGTDNYIEDDGLIDFGKHCWFFRIIF